jgi:hypothetical protein
MGFLMPRLEDLATGTRLTGLAASGSATVESAQWIGEQGLKAIFRDSDGYLGERFVYRDDIPRAKSMASSTRSSTVGTDPTQGEARNRGPVITVRLIASTLGQR